MKPIVLIVLFTGLCTIDEKYLGGRNTATALYSFRATVRVINRYTEELLKPLTR
jgi:hypothetical protein